MSPSLRGVRANDLLRFHLTGEYRARAQEIFRWFVAAHGIRRAIAGSIEPAYFSLCLDLQTSSALHSYLFHDNARVAVPSGVGGRIFREAEEGEFDAIAHFYRANTDGPRDWIEAFLRARFERGELVGLYDQQDVLATGECIPSRAQPPYADLGMVVSHAYRGRGVGAAMLVHLKERCYDAGWQPICSCAADNAASKRAIEKAGFISEHRMVEFVFQEIQERPQVPFLSDIGRYDEEPPDWSYGTLLGHSSATHQHALLRARVTIQSQQEPKNYDWAQNAHDNSTASRGARHVEWGVGAAILILPGSTVL